MGKDNQQIDLVRDEKDSGIVTEQRTPEQTAFMREIIDGLYDGKSVEDVDAVAQRLEEKKSELPDELYSNLVQSVARMRHKIERQPIYTDTFNKLQSAILSEKDWNNIYANKEKKVYANTISMAQLFYLAFGKWNNRIKQAVESDNLTPDQADNLRNMMIEYIKDAFELKIAEFSDILTMKVAYKFTKVIDIENLVRSFTSFVDKQYSNQDISYTVAEKFGPIGLKQIYPTLFASAVSEFKQKASEAIALVTEESKKLQQENTYRGYEDDIESIKLGPPVYLIEDIKNNDHLTIEQKRELLQKLKQNRDKIYKEVPWMKREEIDITI